MKRLVLVVVVVFLAALCVGAAPPSALGLTLGFGSAVSTSVGTSPYQVATGDFNRDGKLDFAAVNNGSGTVSVLLGNGDGTYAAAATSPESVGTSPSGIAAGDFNRDGRLDLAVANTGSDTVSILLATGSAGDFTAGTAVTLTAGDGPVAVAVADLDRDARADLIVACGSGNAVRRMLGNGSGGFGAASSQTVTSPVGLAVGDLNRDLRPDVLATMSGGSVARMTTTTLGALGTVTTYGVGTSPRHVAIGDLNHDGKNDAVVANSGSNTVSVLIGNGSGGLATAVGYSAGSGAHGIAIADLDRDGFQDLVVTLNGAAQVATLRGAGDGTFNAATTFAVQTSPRGVAAVDANRDGRTDIVAANAGSASVSTLLNSTAFAQGYGFEARSTYSTGTGGGPYAMITRDFNRDGTPDVAAVKQGATSYLAIMLGTGTGALGTATLLTSSDLSYPSALVAGDFDGDGYEDVVVANHENDLLCLYPGNGDGTFEPALTTQLFYDFGWQGLDAGDINNDGKLDLAVTNELMCYVSILTNDGTGGFFEDDLEVGDTPSGVVLSDLDLDGDLDVAVADIASNDVAVLRNNGTGNFGLATYYAAGSGPFAVAVGDFNRDAVPDIATSNNAASRVSVLIGNGSGGFAAGLPFTVGTAPRGLFTGDVTRDACDDIVVSNQNAATVSGLIGNGVSSFDATSAYATGTSPFAVSLADLNDDGRLDLLTADMLSNLISVRLGDVTAPSTSHNAPGGWQTAAVTVTLTPSDTGGGVTVTEYKIDAGSWQTGTSVAVPAPTDGSNNGVHTITYRSTDAAGNVEADKTCSVSIDARGPVTTDNAPAGWSSTPVTVTLSPVDNESGVKSTAYKIDSGSWQSGTSVLIPAPAGGGNDGIHTITYRSTDNVDNVESDKTCSVRIDTVTPGAISTLASSTHPVSAAWYASSAPAFSWTAASDATSGVVGYSCLVNQTSNTTPDTSVETTGTSYTSGALADGTWYFHVRAVDSAGNGGTASHYTLHIDTTAPGSISGLASSSHPVSATWYANNTPAFSWSAATDAAPSSGVAGYSCLVDQTSNTTPDTSVEAASTSYVSGALADGTWYFHVRAIDGAGNGGATSHYMVRIDTNAPSIVGGLASSTHPVSATWYANGTPAFSWTAASDAGSGVAGYSYVVDQSAATAPNASVETTGVTYTSTALADGVWYFHVRAVDNVGNAGATSHYEVRIDKTAPAAVGGLASSTHPVSTNWYSNNTPSF